MRRALTGLSIAALLVLGGTSAATADQYPPAQPEITASDVTPEPGQPVTITVTDIEGPSEVTFTVTTGPAGSTLASVVRAGVAAPSVVKPVVNGTASAQFTAAEAGTYAITVTGEGIEPLQVQLVVAPVPTGGDGTGDDGTAGDGLPATGGSVPAGLLWAGAGVLALGGILVTATAVRRRARVEDE